jgi:hypothetical protein
MNRRKGITLTEVMVTMFVMAIGLLALLTLFPLAALNMAQSIQDDRVGHCVANAEAIANMFWDFRPAKDNITDPDPKNPRPHTGMYFLSPGSGPQPADDSPSWPIYIDPVGFKATGASQTWVGGVANRMRRLGSPWLVWNEVGTQQQFMMQNFVLPDDFIFDGGGVPRGATNLGLQREGRYSWAYMMRRPRTAEPKIVDLTIVVYAQRGLYSTGVAAGEVPAAKATGTATQNFINVTMNPEPGNPQQANTTMRKGIWVLDISSSVGTETTKFGPVHAHFYRVQNIIRRGSLNYILELQTPLKANVTQLLFMENVVDVVDRGSGWQSPHPRDDT